MRVSLNDLRQACPGLTDDARVVRNLLETGGIEVHSIEREGDDVAFDVELLANRGDHRGLMGVAKEVAARLGIEPVLPARDDLTRIATPADDEFPATIMYTLARAEGDGMAFVGLANEVGEYFGQPLHVFDADRLAGRPRVRFSREGETIDLLGHEGDTVLPAGVLVIADDAGPVALAGILGSKHASPDASTTRLLIESALFDPVSIRRSASTMRISTVASQRFERGGDRAMVIPTLERMSRLARERGIGRLDEGVQILVDSPDDRLPIPASPQGAERLLGALVEREDWVHRLNLLGFHEVAPDEWLVPFARVWDVLEPADLYEEYARSVGFDEMAERSPVGQVGVSPTPAQVGQAATAHVLNAAGFYEVVVAGTYSLQAFEGVAALLPQDHPLRGHVQTVQAQASDDALLKNNIFVHARRALDENARAMESAVRLYEFTRLFEPDASAELGVREHEILWAIASGPVYPWSWSGDKQPYDYFLLSGVVSQIAGSLQRSWHVEPMPRDHLVAPLLHPHQRGILVADSGEEIGFIGTMHPALVPSSVPAGQTAVVFQLRSDVLTQGSKRALLVSGTSPVTRMMDFVLREQPAGEVQRFLEEQGPSWLRAVYVADVYHSAEFGSHELSVTFGLDFEADRSRKAHEVNEAMESLRTAVVGRFGQEKVVPRGA